MPLNTPRPNPHFFTPAVYSLGIFFQFTYVLSR